jgi:PadR family transcriptional regulator
MKGTYLGEFEEIVLLVVGLLGENAYGVGIRSEIVKQCKRSVNIGAVHTALHRLEAKGFLKSFFGETSFVRGGKRKRIFQLTASGIRTLRTNQQLRTHMWNELSHLIRAKA